MADKNSPRMRTLYRRLQTRMSAEDAEDIINALVRDSIDINSAESKEVLARRLAMSCAKLRLGPDASKENLERRADHYYDLILHVWGHLVGGTVGAGIGAGAAFVADIVSAGKEPGSKPHEPPPGRGVAHPYPEDSELVVAAASGESGIRLHAELRLVMLETGRVARVFINILNQWPSTIEEVEVEVRAVNKFLEIYTNSTRSDNLTIKYLVSFPNQSIRTEHFDISPVSSNYRELRENLSIDLRFYNDTQRRAAGDYAGGKLNRHLNLLVPLAALPWTADTATPRTLPT